MNRDEQLPRGTDPEEGGPVVVDTPDAEAGTLDQATPDGGSADGTASRRAGRNVVAVVTAELLGKAATVAFTVVVARELGATAFGSFSYALAFGLLLATFVAWGFDAEVLRRGSADRRVLNDVLGQAVLLRTFHAVPIVVLGSVIGILTRPDAAAAQALILVLLATLLDSYGDAGRASATACEQPGRASFALVVQRVSACVLAIGVLAAGGGLVAVCAAYLASSAAGLVILSLILKRLGVRPQLHGADRPALVGMWRSTFVLGLEQVLGMALFRIDAIILGELSSDRHVAAYAVGYRLMETVLFVTWSVSRSLFPAMVRAGSGRALLAVAENAMAVAAAVLMPYGFLMLIEGGRILRLLFGEEYGAESTVSLQWLAFAPVAFALQFFIAYVLLVQNRKKWILLTTAFAVVVNLALNTALIPEFGAPGAAFSTTVSYLAAGLMSVVLVSRSAGLFRVDRALLLCLLASLPMAAVLVLLHVNVVVESAVGGVVYLVSYLLIASWWAPEQVALVRSLVRRG